MGSDEHRRMKLQILPIAAATIILFTTKLHADDFPNELNSSIPEPRILLPEQTDVSVFRNASSSRIPSTDPLAKRVYETREASRRRLLSTTEHTPWQIMHGMLALRQDFAIRHNGKTVSGLDWIASGPMFRGESWFSTTPHGGEAHRYSIPYAFEGHINQFLAMLSMSGLPLDHEFKTGSGVVTMRQMLKNAQMTVNEKEEVTWTLWALSRYLPSNAKWRNKNGESWSIERLVRIETAKSLTGAPCGGTHGLFALAHARNVRLRSGEPLRGAWLESEYKIRRYVRTARMQQNSNGTLSSNFFRGREYKSDFDKRMASTGHILEFLMIALPQEELSEPWVRRAIEATCNDLMANRRAYVSCSPLYHSVNALSIYLDRVAANPAEVAARPGKFKSVSIHKELTAKSDVPSDADRVSMPASAAATAESVLDLQQAEIATDADAADEGTIDAVDDDDNDASAETGIGDTPGDQTSGTPQRASEVVPAEPAAEPMEPASARHSTGKPDAVLSGDDDDPSTDGPKKKTEPVSSETPEKAPPAEPANSTADAQASGVTAADEKPDSVPELREATEPLKPTPPSDVKPRSKNDAAAPSKSVSSRPPQTSAASADPALKLIPVKAMSPSMAHPWKATSPRRRSPVVIGAARVKTTVKAAD
jgi:hypothetical protein